MSPRLKLAAISGFVIVIGVGLVALANADLVLAVLGILTIAAGFASLAASEYTHRPSRRLPEGMRPQKLQVSTLVLGSEMRITAIAVLPGGYVRPRKTDPSFDARRVQGVTLASENDYELERKRQRRP